MPSVAFAMKSQARSLLRIRPFSPHIHRCHPSFSTSANASHPLSSTKAIETIDETPVTSVDGMSLPPDVLWKHSDEFPEWKLQQHIQSGIAVYKRITLLAAVRIFNVPTLVNLIGVGAIVYGIGAAEGYMLISSAPITAVLEEVNAAGNTAASFSNAYALANMIPSCAYSFILPEFVASSIDLHPDVVHALTHDQSPAAHIAARNLCSTRGIAAGFGILSQVLRIVNVTMDSGKRYRTRVLDGKEHIFSNGIGRRFVRVCGRHSEVTVTTLRRCGHHVLPVFEDQHLARATLRRCALLTGRIGDPFHSNATAPIYMHVPREGYGSPVAWRCLARPDALEEGVLLPAVEQDGTTGIGILCMEADGTSRADPMGLLGQPGDDLSVEHATQAFSQIERLATKANLKFRSLRVYLGNQGQVFSSGSGSSYTLRQQIASRGQMDVVIDSASPIKKEILRWCQTSVAQQTEEDQATGPTPAERLQQQPLPSLLERLIQKWLPDTTMQGTVVLESSSKPYWDAIAEVLHSRGLKVLDAADYDLARIDKYGGAVHDKEKVEMNMDSSELTSKERQEESEVEASRNQRCPPRIIIYPDGAATVNAFSAFARKRRAFSGIERTLVVVPDEESAGLVSNELLTENMQPNVRVLCAAEAYDELFGQVRVWARQGYSGISIQRKLDLQLNYFYKLSEPTENTDASVLTEEGGDGGESTSSSGSKLSGRGSALLRRGVSLDGDDEGMPGT